MEHENSGLVYMKETKMHNEKSANQLRHYDSHVMLRNLASWNPCGCYIRMYLNVVHVHPSIATVLFNGIRIMC